MKWNDKELKTLGDMADAILKIVQSGDQDAADRFMAQYRLESEHADSNVGYLSGYYSPDTMAKIQQMFNVSHPIFGTRTDVTPVEAFDAGFERGLTQLSEKEEK